MKRARNTRGHIPAELVEKILLNLPVKSLLRFSTVSKSWKSTILGGEFARSYRGREMMALKVYSSDGGGKYVACPISALSAEAAPLPLPFATDWYTEVSCGALRCAAAGNTLCLYNPSTRAQRKLPSPRCPPRIGATVQSGRTMSSVHVYGLGHDSNGGDYKIVKSHLTLHGDTELYSLKSDAWRALSGSRREILLCLAGRTDDVLVRFLTRKGVFVSGKLHWVVFHCPLALSSRSVDILTFDVATESYAKLAALPPLPESFLSRVWSDSRVDVLDMFALEGRLFVCLDYCRTFFVWARLDDGTWKKDLAFGYKNIHPLCYSFLKPFYFYDADGSVVKAVTSTADIRKLFIYKEKQREDGSSSPSLVEKSFSTKGYGVLASFTYFESLVSPFPSTRE